MARVTAVSIVRPLIREGSNGTSVPKLHVPNLWLEANSQRQAEYGRAAGTLPMTGMRRLG